METTDTTNTRPTFDLLCTGTALLDFIIRGFDPTPVTQTGFRAQSGALYVGGEAVNEAIGAAALGLRTAILAFADTGVSGDIIASALTRAGVSTEYLMRLAEHPTPISTLFVEQDGSRHTITNNAHSFNFHPERYTEALRSARAVTLGSLFRAPYNDPDVLIETVRALPEETLLFADTKQPNFRRLTLDDIREVLPRVDYICPNVDEARFYTGRENPDEMAKVFLSYGVKNVIIKLGGEGSLLRNARERLRLNAFRVPVVDTTGAGDNFLAGFIWALLNGRDHEESLRFANACGAIVSTGVGASGIIQNQEQVEALLRTQPMGLQ